MTKTDWLSRAQNVLDIEIDALKTLRARLDQSIAQACEIIFAGEGRVVVLGVGKSGHIGQKIASTLASTGTPSFFVHPGEASHGDMGMITASDVIIALSNSGETDEIRTLLPLIRKMGVPLITLCGNAQSTLARQADVFLDTSVEKEACPFNLAPTASSTVTLALGDALAVAVLESRGFTAEDFAFSHPGGRLGRRLLVGVEDLMHINDELPLVDEGTSVKEALLTISEKRLGVSGIVDANSRLIGIITDGDIRRALTENDDIAALMAQPCEAIMTYNPKTIGSDTRAYDAMQQMQTHGITNLFVVDEANGVLGLVHIHDLIAAGL